MAKTILIIEDDKSVARLLADVLEGEGYRVLIEGDGEWGLRTFQHKQIDLLILDVLVPKLVGFDLIDQLRAMEKGNHTPLIMISGVYRAGVHRQKMIERYGVVEYLDKPVDLDKLLQHVRTALGQQVTTGRTRSVTGLLSIGPDVRAIDEADPIAKLGTLPVPRRGDLEQIPFARVLGQLFAARASGAIMLRKASVKKIVYLRQGAPVFVKSNLLGECLGHIMVAERLITSDQCDKSVEILKQTKRKQGEILIELGFISPHNLSYALERQLEIKLYDIFSWLEGKYLFNEKDDYQGATVELSLTPAEMVYEGIRRTMSGERIGRELARLEDRIAVLGPDPSVRYQALELNPRAGSLIDAIDGRVRLKDLMARIDLPKEDITTLLYALVCSSLIRLLDAPALQVTLPKRDEVIALSDADTEPLKTGEVSLEDPSMVAIKAARDKAREAKAEVVRSAPIPQSRFESSTQDVPLAEILNAEELPVVMGSSLSIPIVVEEPPPSEPPAPLEERSNPPPLDPSLRDEIRARLEASLHAKLSSLPRPAPEPAPKIERHEPVHAPPSARTKALKLDVDRDRQKQRDDLEQLAASLRAKDHYTRLGLERDATESEINLAFDSLARAHQPDRLVPGGTPREARVLAEEISLLFRRAKETLSDPRERAAYDRAIAGIDGHEGIAAKMRAEHAFQLGQHYADQGDWIQAYESFHAAVDLDPDEGEYLAHLSWAAFCANPEDGEAVSKALADLARAQDLSPRCEDTYVFSGLILEKLGQREDAIRHLRRALQCNADSVRALRMLRVLAPPVEKKPGLFGRRS